MTRVLCATCKRPTTACICQFMVTIDNSIHVVVLQHPGEVSQAKGTVTLLDKSLSKSCIIIGEDFTHNEEFQQLLIKYRNRIALLYPSDSAIEIDYPVAEDHLMQKNDSQTKRPIIECIIILDGTWKKSYRMFMLNNQLQNLEHIVLPGNIESYYEIRKTKKDNALSSLEACCHALSILENNANKYQGLLNNFVKFNQFQLSFIHK